MGGNLPYKSPNPLFSVILSTKFNLSPWRESWAGFVYRVRPVQGCHFDILILSIQFFVKNEKSKFAIFQGLTPVGLEMNIYIRIFIMARCMDRFLIFIKAWDARGFLKLLDSQMLSKYKLNPEMNPLLRYVR